MWRLRFGTRVGIVPPPATKRLRTVEFVELMLLLLKQVVPEDKY